MNNPSFFTMVIELFAMTAAIAGLPIFVATTQMQSVSNQRKTTLVLAATYVIAGLIALFAGNALLAFFGISVAALRVAGMAVVATIGWKMLNAETPMIDSEGKTVNQSGNTGEQQPQLQHAASNTKVPDPDFFNKRRVPTPSEVGIVPLGFPIYAGPGVLSVIITWSSTSHDLYLPAVGAVLINAVVIIFLNFLANPITKIVGAQGLLVTEKVFGLFVLAIAVAGVSSALLILFPGLGR